MEVFRTHVAGVDVHKDMLAVTVLRGEAGAEPEKIQLESKTFTEDLESCGEQLLELGVRDVAMEATGSYWKPVYNVWSKMGISITLGQASHIKNLRRNKTDIKDSEWIADLHRHGLIRPSFIPKEKIQHMRLFTRHRTNLTRDLTQVKNRIQKTLEEGNIKWGTIVSDVFGKSGLQVLKLLAEGVTDATTLSSAVTTNIKRKEEAKKSLTNCFTEEHCYLIKILMSQYDHITSQIKEVDEKLKTLAQPYRHLIDELKKIPGIKELSALGILAETGDDMSHFRNERVFAAWSGVAPGNNESAGKKKRSKCRKGSPHLKRLLVQTANSAVRKKNSFYKAKYNKLTFRLGSRNKAKVAIANRISRAVYKVLAGDRYKELTHNRVDTNAQEIKKLVHKLRFYGADVQYKTEKIMVTHSVKAKSA